ncbi:MAG: chemotaxis protein CheW [Deltaproteobacteria bacterium]|nr:chemotaxis protein CheW [Deltaproteobacteria bacterium]MCB9785620.1 chemotaxis protein CheW [Deltaproteobacteria bacterium]
MSESPSLASKALALRRAFDASFAEPATRGEVASVDLLLLRAGARRYAVRLRDVAEIAARRPVVPVPSSAPHLLGLAGLRGTLLPVFDLAGLLGEPASSSTPGWLLVCERADPIALAVRDLEGHVRLPSASIRAVSAADHDHRFGREMAHTDAGPCLLLEISRLTAAIRAPTSPATAA